MKGGYYGMGYDFRIFEKGRERPRSVVSIFHGE